MQPLTEAGLHIVKARAQRAVRRYLLLIGDHHGGHRHHRLLAAEKVLVVHV